VGVLAGVKEALGPGVGVIFGVDVDVRATSGVLVRVKEAFGEGLELFVGAGGRVGVGVKVGAGVTVAASPEEAGVRIVGGFSTTTGVRFDPLVTDTQPTFKPKDRSSSSSRQFFIPSLFSPFICGPANNL
jgi:hypothetical protein